MFYNKHSNKWAESSLALGMSTAKTKKAGFVKVYGPSPALVCMHNWFAFLVGALMLL